MIFDCDDIEDMRLCGKVIAYTVVMEGDTAK
jgi:hypothetical protein